MPGTYVTDGTISDNTPSQPLGGLCTGIGNSARQSSNNAIQSVTAADFAAARIGYTGGVSQLGTPTFVPGSGYTNGTYQLTYANGGLSGGGGDTGAVLQVVVAGGALQQPTVVNPGRNLTSTPTVSLATLGGGAGGSITNVLVADGSVVALGAAYGAGKGTRYVTANASAAIGAAVSPSTYINRSTRAVASGDSLWAVAP